MAHVPAVRRRSVRVALAATGIVAVVYLAVAAGVVAFTTRELTAQIDHRLADSFGRLPADGGDGSPPGGLYDPGGDPDRTPRPCLTTCTTSTSRRRRSSPGRSSASPGPRSATTGWSWRSRWSR